MSKIENSIADFKTLGSLVAPAEQLVQDLPTDDTTAERLGYETYRILAHDETERATLTLIQATKNTPLQKVNAGEDIIVRSSMGRGLLFTNQPRSDHAFSQEQVRVTVIDADQTDPIRLSEGMTYAFAAAYDEPLAIRTESSGEAHSAPYMDVALTRRLGSYGITAVTQQP